MAYSKPAYEIHAEAFKHASTDEVDLDDGIYEPYRTEFSRLQEDEQQTIISHALHMRDATVYGVLSNQPEKMSSPFSKQLKNKLNAFLAHSATV